MGGIAHGGVDDLGVERRVAIRDVGIKREPGLGAVAQIHAAGLSVVAADGEPLRIRGRKVYDGLLDPALGTLSDRTQSRWGLRLPFLLIGTIVMPLAVIAVFNPPDFSSLLVRELFVVVALSLHPSAYTALTIPGMAMLVEATYDYQERC